MKKAWKIVSTIALCVLALGCVLLGLAVIMDANLVRIADVVFSKYDVAALYSGVQTVADQLISVLPF